VLAHGYYVQAEQWQDVVWGDPSSNHLGRVPRAVLIALDQPNPLLLFGTGAAAGDGVLESEHTLHFARNHRADLYDLVSESLGVPRERSRLLVDDLLDERSLCERTSTTTRTEVAAALETSLQHGAGHLTLVSSPTHIARCLQSALTLLAGTSRYRRFAGQVSAVASDTTVAARGPGDVVVLEPQTHPSHPNALDFADVARAALPLLGRPEADDYLQEWLQLTQTWLTRTRDQDS
jgi:hypothetical protein